MKESVLWHRRLLPAAKAFGPGAHLTRVEDALRGGRSDVEGCVEGVSLVIELKIGPLVRGPPPAVRLQHPLTVSQHRFLIRRIRSGGTGWVFLQVGKGSTARRFLVPGAASGVLLRGKGPVPLRSLEALAVEVTNTNGACLVSRLLSG